MQVIEARLGDCSAKLYDGQSWKEVAYEDGGHVKITQRRESYYSFEGFRVLREADYSNLESLSLLITDDPIRYIADDNAVLLEVCKAALSQSTVLHTLKVSSYVLYKVLDYIPADRLRSLFVSWSFKYEHTSTPLVIKLPDKLRSMKRLQRLNLVYRSYNRRVNARYSYTAHDYPSLLELAVTAVSLPASFFKSVPTVQSLTFKSIDTVPIFFSLSRLKKVSMHWIQKNVNIYTDSWADLRDLEYLDIRSVEEGLPEVPLSIGKLPAIKHLRLSDCKLKELPDFISSMQTLVRLDVSENSLSDIQVLPPALTVLRAEKNRFKSVPTALSAADPIDIVDISTSSLHIDKEEMLELLSKCKSLSIKDAIIDFDVDELICKSQYRVLRL